jgi:hypothetical protein
MRRRHMFTAVLALALVVAAPAVARPSSSTGSALVGPTVAHVGDRYTVIGTGFAPGSLVPLEIAEAGGCCIALNMLADGDGRFSYTGEVWATGAYRVRASAQRNGSGRWRVVASWSFDAYP